MVNIHGQAVEFESQVPATAQTVVGSAGQAATLTFAAQAGVSQVLKRASVSFTGSNIANLPHVVVSVLDGATTVWSVNVAAYGTAEWSFPEGIAGTVGNALAVNVTAGDSGTVARLSATAGVV